MKGCYVMKKKISVLLIAACLFATTFGTIANAKNCASSSSETSISRTYKMHSVSGPGEPEPS